ncbi:hypothetical protein H6504_04555 [Candidatus Woesearchaeota archaeon]|nr:hypothetical protein [Candidatus Woesearchaeota archaeon]
MHFKHIALALSLLAETAYTCPDMIARVPKQAIQQNPQITEYAQIPSHLLNKKTEDDEMLPAGFSYGTNCIKIYRYSDAQPLEIIIGEDAAKKLHAYVQLHDIAPAYASTRRRLGGDVGYSSFGPVTRIGIQSEHRDSNGNTSYDDFYIGHLRGPYAQASKKVNGGTASFGFNDEMHGGAFAGYILNNEGKMPDLGISVSPERILPDVRFKPLSLEDRTNEFQ